LITISVGVGVGVGVSVAEGEEEGEGEGVGVGVKGGVGDGVGVGGGVVAVGVGVTLEGAGTKIGLLVPVMEGSVMSVAVIVCCPGMLSVTRKKAVPLVKVLLGVRFPLLVLVKCTVPV